MARAKAIQALKHINLFNAEKEQAVRDLGAKHNEEIQALKEQHKAEYQQTVGAIDRQRHLDVTEAVGRYVAAGLPIPHFVYQELGKQVTHEGLHVEVMTGRLVVNGTNGSAK